MATLPITIEFRMELYGTTERPGHQPGAYASLLTSFLRKGYDFVLFHQLNGARQGQLILRHDVDFDTNAALEMAEVEARLGVRSTYFFLLGSKMYNLLNPLDAANVKAIQDLGHQVSLHFDATLYDDIGEGLAHEIAIFKACFQQEVRIMSFHRPDMRMIARNDRPMFGVEHTYQSKYFRDIKYMSDSTGEWRYGHPCDSDAFAERRSIQLLLHPIWWMFEGEGSVSKLEAFVTRQHVDLRKEVAMNCIPFRQTLAEVEVR